ncbi:MAG TPA: hypothetical protein VIW29_15020 [Polyangiaceae bacterium]
MLPVATHSLAGCGVPESQRDGQLELQALGDFAASNDSAEILPLEPAGGVAIPLRFPAATRAIEARFDTSQPRFIGYGERVAETALDVLLWPELTSCSIYRPDGDQGYPGKQGGQALGYVSEHGLVAAAGGNDALVSDAIVGALSFRVTDGALASFDTSPQIAVLREARAFATATEFDGRLLIAGGQEPQNGVPEQDLEPRSTAEIFDPLAGAFVGELIELRNNRTRHAAVKLVDGSTLLVGGRTKTGSSNTAQQLTEVISPQTRLSELRASIGPRIDPVALLLSDGRVFVGGGVDLDGLPVSSPVGEWLSPDATRNLASTGSELPPRAGRAFVAMPGAAVLIVDGEADDDGLFHAWWLDAEGKVEDIELSSIFAANPRLLPGSDGRPWLIAALASAQDVPRLFRFDPWAKAFELADVPADLRLPRPRFPQPVAIDPDAFVWLDDDQSAEHGELVGLRLGTRNRFTQDVALVLLSDPLDPARPLHLAPAHAVNAAEVYADAKLHLAPGDDGGLGLAVLVTDTDYAEVTITLHVAPDSPALPVVMLGEAALGGSACPWPEGPALTQAEERPTVIRSGQSAQLLYGGESVFCSVAAGRLTLGLRAEGAPAIVSQLDVQRGAPESD